MTLEQEMLIREKKVQARTEQCITELCSVMEKDGRTEEFLAAMKDTVQLHQLYKEYNIDTVLQDGLRSE